MDDTTGSDTAAPAESNTTADEHTNVHLDDELLVEEISIDGMCGVY